MASDDFSIDHTGSIALMHITGHDELCMKTLFVFFFFFERSRGAGSMERGKGEDL